MNPTYKKQVFIAFFIVFLLFVIVGSFFLFFFEKKDSSYHLDDFYVSFETSDILSIKNTLPISDTVGRNLDGTGTEDGVQGYVSFSVKNKGKNDIPFEIFITKQDVDNYTEIKESYVKLLLTDENNQPLKGFDGNSVPSFADLSFLNDKPSSKYIYSASLKAGESKKYILKIWLSDLYAISLNEERFSVDVDVRVK